MSFYRNVSPQAPQLKVGQVVAYDYLHNSKAWQWTLGTVREVKEFSATIQQWGLHTGDAGSLRSILTKEVDAENNRLKNFQDLLSVARDTLASIRRSNEDRVSRARDAYNAARQKMEVIDEVALRKVTAQAAPSPVAVAVLKAVLAVSKCDPTAVEFYEWADVQLEFRKGDPIDTISRTDVVAKLYPSPETLLRALEQDVKLNYKAATRDSPVVASLHSWVTTALAYQQAYSNLAHDKRIQEQNDAIASAIAGMKACRAKIATLKEELSAKNASARPGQVTSFTKTSVLMPIPLSAVICPVHVDSKVEDCVLTNDEVEQILVDAKAMRFQLKSQMNSVVAKYAEAAAELHSLSLYTTELEEKRLYLQEHYFSTILRGGDVDRAAAMPSETQSEIQRLNALVAELEKHDERWEPERDTATLTTGHKRVYAGSEWPEVLEERPEEVRAAFAYDTALAAHVDPNFVHSIEFRQEGGGMTVKCEVTHPAKMSRAELDKRLSEMPSRLMDYIYNHRDAPKIGLDRAIAEICHALGIDETKFTGLGFDQFVRQLAGFDYLGDKDAYESEIGDLLMLLDKINNENRSLQYTLEKSADRFKKQAAALQREQDALNVRNAELADEIDRLRNLVEKLKDLADKQGGELEQFHVQQQQAKQLRAQRNLVVVPSATEEPLYAVTMDELNAQRAQCEEAERQAADLARTLQATEDEVHQLEEQLHDVEKKLNDANDQVDEALRENAKKDAELAAFRQKRHDAKEARADEPELAAVDGVPPRSARASSRGRPVQQADPAAQAVDPAVIAEEPLYAVTVEEFKNKHAALEKAQDELEKEQTDNEKLADELAKAQDEAEKLANELAALQEEIREKDRRAAEQRAHFPELAASARHPDSVRGHPVRYQDAAAEPRYPDLDEPKPLYAVTIDEYANKKEEADKLHDAVEEKLAELAKAQDEAEKLAAELADRDAEVAAFRQKRHDAKEARADEPELAAVDGVPPRSARASSRGRPVQQADPAAQAVDPAVIAEEPLYAVTVEEFKDKHAALEKAQDELEKEKADNEKLADELAKAQDEAEKLAAELADRDAEVAAFRQKRHDAKEARADEPELAAVDGVPPRSARASSRGRPVQQTDPAAQAVDPAVIAEEPLYAVTVEEFKDKHAALEKAQDEAEKLADELEKQKADNEKLADEAEKLADDLEKQKADNEKLADEAEKLADDLEKQKADNEKLAEEAEKLADDLEQQKADNEKLADELEKEQADNEKLADELAKAQDEAEKLAAELADRDAEVAAFRQKRHDAKEARADEPELAAVDGVPPRSARASSRGRPVQQADPAAQAVDPAVIAEEPLYAVTVEEFKNKHAALEKAQDEAEKLADELEKQKADNEKLADEAEKLADDLEKQKADNEKLADELEKEQADNEKLADELAKAQDEAEKLAAELADRDAEVAAFRQKRHDAKEARADEPELAAVDGVPPRSARASSRGRPVQQTDPAAQAVDPAVIAEEPLYAVTVEEFKDKHAALEKAQDEAEKLADDLEKQKADNEKLAEEAEKLADDLEQQKADNEKLADELEKEQADNEKLADELAKAQDEAEKLAAELADRDAEVAAFRQKRHDAKEARADEPELAAVDGVPPRSARASSRGRPVQQADPAAQAVDPAVIAEEPLYAVTVEEFKDKHAALEKAQDELEKEKADNEKLADELAKAQDEAEKLAAELADRDAEVAAFRQKRHDAKEARADEPELAAVDGVPPRSARASSRGRPVQQADPAAQAVDPAVIAEEPLYAVTVEEFKNKHAALEKAQDEAEKLADELEKQKADNEKLADEAEKLADDLEKQKADNEKLAEEAEKLADDLEQQKADNEKLADELEKEQADNEKLADELAKAQDEAEKLAAELADRDAEVAAFRQKRHDAKEARADEPELAAVDGVPPRSARASSRGRPVQQADPAAQAVDPAVIAEEPLYAVTVEEFKDKHAALEKAQDELEKEKADNEKLADELAKAQDEAEKLAAELADRDAEVAAFRQKRHDAKEARADEPELAAVDGVPPRSARASSRGRPVQQADPAAQAVDPAVIAEEPLYAVTVEEFKNKHAALEKAQDEAEKLADELEKQKADNEKLADEAEKLADDLEQQKADNEKLADELEKEQADNEKLADELAKAQDEAEKLAAELADRDAEVAAFRQKRHDAKEARADEPELAAVDGVPPRSARASSRGRPVQQADPAAQAVDPAVIAEEPLYAVTVEEFKDKHAALEKAQDELEKEKADNEKLADELAKAQDEAEKLAAELADRDAEVAAFRQKRHDAKEARADEPELAAVDGVPPRSARASSRGRPVQQADPAAQAVDPAVIAEEPLYAVTVEEFKNKHAALEKAQDEAEKLADELEKQKADNEKLADEAEKLADELEKQKADNEKLADEAEKLADDLEKQKADNEKLAEEAEKLADDLEQQKADNEKLADELEKEQADNEKLADELAKAQDEAEKLAAELADRDAEVAAFRQKRHDAKEARADEPELAAVDGVPPRSARASSRGRPVQQADPAAQAVDPAVIAEEPLYAVTVEEFKDKHAALEKAQDELEKEKADNEKLADELAKAQDEAEKLAAELADRDAEVAAFRQKRHDAKEARADEPELAAVDGVPPRSARASSRGRPVQQADPAAQAVDPAVIAEEPLYAVTVEEFKNKHAALEKAQDEAEKLADELEKQKADNEKLADEAEKLADELEKQKADNEKLADEAEKLADDLEKQKADNEKLAEEAEKLADDLEQQKADNEKLADELEKEQADNEKLADELAKAQDEAEKLAAELADRDAEVAAFRQKRHDAKEARADEPELAAVDGVPPRSARASSRGRPVQQADPAAQAVDPAVIAEEPLYAVTVEEFKNKHAALEKAQDEAEKLADELEKQKADNEKLADEAEKLADDLEQQKADNEKLADELEKEQADNEKLADELAKAQDEAEKLAAELADRDAEVAAFRQKRHDAKEARADEPELAAVDGVPPRSARASSRGRPVQQADPAAQAVDPAVIAEEPLYAVTVEEFKDKHAALEKAQDELEKEKADNEKLADELAKAQDEAEKLAAELADRDAEVAAFRQKRHDAKEARADEPELAAVDGVPPRSARASSRGRPVQQADPAAQAVDPAVIAEEPLYAVTVEEFKDKHAALEKAQDEAEKLADELEKQKADNEKLADELEKEQADNEKLADELAKAQDEAEKLAAELADRDAEVAAFRQKRHDAKEARADEPELAAVDGVPPRSARASSRGRPVQQADPAAQAVDPAVIAEEPLYAVTVEEFKDKHAALEKAQDEAEKLADELEKQKADNEKLADEAEKLADDLEKQKADNEKLAEEAEKLADDLEQQKADNEKLADELEKEQADNEKLADELAKAQDEAEKLAAELADRDAEVAAFRQKRHDAKEARADEPELAAVDGVPPRSARASSRGRPVQQADPAAQAVDPAVIAEEPLYAVTVEEFKNKHAALEKAQDEAEKLADELEKQKADNEKLADEAEKLADDLEKQKADNEKLADELEKEQADNEKLADELAKAQDEAEKLAAELADRDAEVAAFRQKRHDAKEARADEPELAAVDGVPPRSARASSRGRPVQQADPAAQAVDPAVIAEEPLYAVTVEEFKNKHAALEKAQDEAEKLADELEKQKADNEKLADEAEKLADDLEKQKADNEKLADELEKEQADNEKLADELAKAQDEAEKLAAELADRDAEVAAFRQKRHDAKEARADEPELAAVDGVPPRSARASSRGRPVQQADPAAQAVDPAVIAEEPLYAVTVEEFKNKHAALEKAQDEAEKLADELEKQKADNEKLADEAEKLADDLEKQKADNEKLADELEKEQADNEKLADELAKAQDEAEKLAAELADRDAEVAAFRQKRHDAKEARADEPELAAVDGVPPRSARASSRGRPVQQADPAAQAVDPAVIAEEPLYAVTVEEFKNKHAALEKAQDEAEKLADELEKQKADNEKLADEAEKLADDLEKQKADNEKLADELEKEQADNEKLADELAKAQDEAEKLAAELADRDAEVAAFRQKRHDAKEARADEPELAAVDGVPPRSARASSRGRPVQQADPAAQAVDPAVIAEEPLYAVTVEEFKDKHAALEKAQDELEKEKADNEKLADELAKAQDEAEKLAAELADRDAEVAAFRQKRHDAKEARADEPELAAVDGVPPRSARASSRGRPVQQADPAAQAVDPAVIAEEPLYAVTVEEFKNKHAALEKAQDEAEKLADELEKQKADNEKLADELEKEHADAEKLAEELQKQRNDNDRLADELESAQNDAEKLAEHLEQQKADNEKLADELEKEQADNEKLADSLEEARSGAEKLADELEKQLGENKKLEDDVAAATAAAEEAGEAAKEQAMKNEQLMDELTRMAEEVDALKNAALEAENQHEEDRAAAEAEFMDVLMELKKLHGINEALERLLGDKEREIKGLNTHNELWPEPSGDKNQMVTRHTKIFDGNWEKLLRERPEALFAAFVIDSSNACHVPGDHIEKVNFDHD